MIQGETGKDIFTKEYIFSKITSYDIYRYYLGEFKVGVVFCNPLRGEKKPSMIVRYRNGELYHEDYGDDQYRGNCFSLAMQRYRCGYNEALVHILKDFQLSDKTLISSPIVEWKQPKHHESIPPPFIQVKARKFNKAELDYWARLGIGLERLKKEHVYVPKEIYRNRKLLPSPVGLTFCYYYPHMDKWKIYRPFVPKREGKISPEYYKFDSNVPFDYVEGIRNIKDCENSFLTKSKKDSMFFKELLQTECVYNVQAENSACISDEDIKYVQEHSKVQWVIGDSDAPGKKFTWWLTNTYNYKHINLPDEYLPLKDFTDLAYYKGIEVVKDYFIKKGIISNA